MKIAIDVSQMCYLGTGVARYTHGLTRALLQLRSVHSFILYAGALQNSYYFRNLSKISPWNKATWNIFPLPPKLAGYAFNKTSIPFELLVGKVDLIHASDWSQPSAKANIVTTIHDLVFKKYPETLDPLILNTQIQRLAKIINSNTHIITDSMSTKNDLAEIYGISKTRISVIYPGIDSIYKPQSKKEIDRVKTKYNLPGQFVLSVGTQEPRKNLERLTKAVQKLGLPLVLVGKHGWGAKTQTLGYVPDSDLPAIYSACSTFAYPSLYEGFGFPVLEAMACGAPVVTSNISSLPEVAGDACVLVDPTEVDSITQGIKTALANSAALIKKGLVQSSQFSWEQTAQQTLEVYEKIAHRD